MNESYEINDSNCYRIRRLEENLYKDYLPDNYKFDDITMLMFDYKAEKGDAKMTNKTFPAKVEALDNVISFVEEALESFLRRYLFQKSLKKIRKIFSFLPSIMWI